MKAAVFAGSLMPGADSMPLATSTPHGSTSAIAVATLSGARPPARTKARRVARQAPVEDLAAAAAAGGGRVEQDRLGRPDVELREVAAPADRDRLPHRAAGEPVDRGDLGGRLIAVELDRVEREIARDRS